VPNNKRCSNQVDGVPGADSTTRKPSSNAVNFIFVVSVVVSAAIVTASRLYAVTVFFRKTAHFTEKVKVQLLMPRDRFLPRDAMRKRGLCCRHWLSTVLHCTSFEYHQSGFSSTI